MKDGSSMGSERFDRAQWKTMQLTLNDSTKFVDIMHNVAWEDGLPNDVRAGRSCDEYIIIQISLVSTIRVVMHIVWT